MDRGVKPVQLLRTNASTPVNNDVRVEALGERDNVAASAESRMIIAENPDVRQNVAIVDLVKHLLSPNGSRDRRESAAARLNELNFGINPRMVTVARDPVVLAGLVRLLYLHTSPQAQKFAARVLMALTIEDNNIVTVFPGALAGLMQLLYVKIDLVAPYFAASVLACLTEMEGNGFTIAEFPGALQGLVGLLRWTGHVPVQEASAGEALRALINLARQDERRYDITMCSGALEGLVELLQEGSDCVKEKAVETLGNLSAPETSIIIIGFEGVQQGLVDLLFRNDNSNLQTVAAKALGDIAVASELGYFIATFPRALEGLAALLSKHWSPDGQQQAARTISYLAKSDSADSGVVAAMLPHILQSMVRLLAEDEDTTTQEHTLRAFTYLSRLPENKIMISQDPYALEGIGRLYSTSLSQGVREQAKKALANLHSEFKGFTEVPRNPRLALPCIDNNMGTGVPEQVEKVPANFHSQFRGFATEVPQNPPLAFTHIDNNMDRGFATEVPLNPRLALAVIDNNMGIGEQSTEEHMGEEHDLSHKSNETEITFPEY